MPCHQQIPMQVPCICMPASHLVPPLLWPCSSKPTHLQDIARGGAAVCKLVVPVYTHCPEDALQQAQLGLGGPQLVVGQVILPHLEVGGHFPCVTSCFGIILRVTTQRRCIANVRSLSPAALGFGFLLPASRMARA